MKTRIITGLLIFLFVLPFVAFGNHFMMAFIILLLGLGTYEFLNAKAKAKQDKIPLYVYIISFIFAYLIVFDLPIYNLSHSSSSLVLMLNEGAFNYKLGVLQEYFINPIWIISYVFVLFACSVFDKKFKITDAMYTFATIIYLSLGLKGMLYLRSWGINKYSQNTFTGLAMLIYVLVVTCSTDIFAYFGGMTCYKLLGADKVHKLNERISPKKTIEGTIIGTLLATIFGFFVMTYLVNGGSYDNWYLSLLLSFMLSICGQIGDLILSAVKREYGIKDYSNLLPGHGGVLDRLDSLLINCMIAAVFIALMTENIIFLL